MLCRIDPSVNGTVTDAKALAINYLRALQAICTAAAGSTPSVPSQTANTASPSGPNVITQVISNAEAGGWTASDSTNVVTNYNPSLAAPYQVDLFRDSGKSTYPFQKLSFRTNYFYLFNGQFNTYPNLYISYGFNEVANASGNYLLGSNVVFPDSGGRPGHKFEAAGVSNSDTSTASIYSLKFTNRETLIASTQDYFVIMDGDTLGIGNDRGHVIYVGRRTTQSWEDAYSDNPPLASVCYDASHRWSSQVGMNASMFARTYHSSGVVNNDPLWYRINNGFNSGPISSPSAQATTGGGNGITPLTGLFFQGSQHNTYNFPYFFSANEMQVPMLPYYLGPATSKQDSLTHLIPPANDANGNFVPPAYPITFARNVLNSHTAGGQAIGLYYSMGGTRSYLANYVTTGQEFTLGNDTYYAYTIGHQANYADVFLVRKA